MHLRLQLLPKLIHETNDIDINLHYYKLKTRIYS